MIGILNQSQPNDETGFQKYPQIIGFLSTVIANWIPFDSDGFNETNFGQTMVSIV